MEAFEDQLVEVQEAVDRDLRSELKRIMFESEIVQTALSIYWGLLGFAGMIWGARGARRAVWLAGAGFMGLVVVKLFLVDLGNSGTLARIISFIGIGTLLLVVGYFAPAPPKQAAPKE